MKKTVKPSNFVKRQIQGSGKTYSKTLDFQEIAEIAQDKLNAGDFIEGYRFAQFLGMKQEGIMKKYDYMKKDYMRYARVK